jgi:ribosomal protein S27AE
MIARQQIKITDSVAVSGGSGWVPITQSPFARYIVTQASVDRLAASTCPRCGAAMVAVVRPSSMATILIIVGIICTVFLIGIVFIIMGVMMRRKRNVRYQCPRCNYIA